MRLEKKIRNQLALYTSGGLDMEKFRHWFAPVLRDVHNSGEAGAERLAHLIEWEFVDFERGMTPDETVLRSKLKELASAVFAVANPPSSENSAVEFVRQEILLQPQGAILVEAAGTSGGYTTTVLASESPVRNESSFTLQLNPA
jgi:hypothetical protein